jgi:hypothetical protein
MRISLIVQIFLIKIYTRFTDLYGAMSMQNRVFWVVTPSRPMSEGNMLPLSSTLMMKAVHSSKMMVPTYTTTQCNNPESKSEHDNELHRFRIHVKYSMPVNNSAL